jgi:hypothetical protein
MRLQRWRFSEPSDVGTIPRGRIDVVGLGDLAGTGIGNLGPGAAFMCGHCERGMTAASLAERSGLAATVLLGGPRDWARQTGGSLVRR